MGDVLAHESELLGLVKEVCFTTQGSQKEILYFTMQQIL